jgi:anaerobic selenocysteine-containing dehydrogenase
MSNAGAWTMDPARAAGAVPENGAPRPRDVNMNQTGRVLVEADDPKVMALFVYNCNPLAILPRQELVRQGLEREDLFTVVFDQVMTDSARYADVVLPATTFLEHQEIRRGYGSMVLLEGHPVIDRVGESRPNVEVFAALEERLGLRRPGDLTSEDAITEALLSQTGRGGALREALDRDGYAYPECGPLPQQFVDSFPRTPDRKVHLVPETLDRDAPDGLYVYGEDPGTAEFPLALISPASERAVSSTLFQLERNEVPLEIAASDAKARGISEGDLVRVFNSFGEIVCTVTLSSEMKDGLVLLPKGLWSHHTRSGKTSNTLCPDTLTDLGGGACFNDARVQVEKA